MSISMYIVGVGIFVVYMFFLLRMIVVQHKIQEREMKRNVKGNKIKIKKSNKVKIK